MLEAKSLLFLAFLTWMLLLRHANIFLAKKVATSPNDVYIDWEKHFHSGCFLNYSNRGLAPTSFNMIGDTCDHTQYILESK